MAKRTKGAGGLKTRVRGGYREYWDPKVGCWRRTHRRVIEKRLGAAAKALEVHHLDLDRLNNRPRNLVGLTSQMHARIHQEPAACLFDLGLERRDLSDEGEILAAGEVALRARVELLLSGDE